MTEKKAYTPGSSWLTFVYFHGFDLLHSVADVASRWNANVRLAHTRHFSPPCQYRLALRIKRRCLTPACRPWQVPASVPRMMVPCPRKLAACVLKFLRSCIGRRLTLWSRGRAPCLLRQSPEQTLLRLSKTWRNFSTPAQQTTFSKS